MVYYSTIIILNKTRNRSLQRTPRSGPAAGDSQNVMPTNKNIRPNKAELAFLHLAYNRFYDIFNEVMNDSFWRKKRSYRFSRLSIAFIVYSELLNYEPIRRVIEHLKTNRPPMEAEIGSDLFRMIRNLVTHFPFFDNWDDVYITKSLANWCRPGESIDRFLTKYAGMEPVKYRFWEGDKKRMTYLSINFPEQYDEDVKAYLRDILTEKEGVRFSFILMKQIMDTQREYDL